MKDTTINFKYDTVVDLKIQGTTIKNPIILENKHSIKIENDESNVSDYISIGVSIFIFLLGYLFNKTERNVIEKKRLKRKFGSWKRDIDEAYKSIIKFSSLPKHYSDFLQNEKWELGYPKKHPYIFEYHLSDFNKNEFFDSLRELEKIPENEAHEMTYSLVLCIEKVKHYESLYEQTIELLSEKWILLNESFSDGISALNDQIEKVISEKTDPEFCRNLTHLYHDLSSQMVDEHGNSNLDPYVLKENYLKKIEDFLFNYESTLAIHSIYSLISQLEVILIKFGNERITAIANLNLQFNEVINVAMVWKKINERIKKNA